MTAPARISQHDMDRTMKAVMKAGISQARIVMDLENGKIEVIIGESAPIAANEDQHWDDEDI